MYRLFIMDDDECCARHSHGTDLSVQIFVLQPVLELWDIYRWKIVYISQQRNSSWARWELASIYSVVEVAKDDIAEVASRNSECPS